MHAAQLDEVSRELWFFDNEPTEFDKERSKDRKWWLKPKKNGIIEENDIMYYSDPIERQQNYIGKRVHDFFLCTHACKWPLYHYNPVIDEYDALESRALYKIRRMLSFTKYMRVLVT